MTCIVAIKSNKGVMMGADSCGCAGHRASSVRTPKVSVVGEYLIGYTTSFRMGQILHYAMSTKKHNPKDDLFLHLVKVLIPEVRESLKAGGWLHIKENQESGGEFLLAHERRLFVVQTDFSVLEYEDDYVAVGCGEEWAVGALYALRGTKMPHKRMLTTALEAASRFSSCVRPPFQFVQNY